MSRSSLNKKIEEIKKLEELGMYIEAAEAADKIQWEKIKDIRLLSRVSGIYEKCGRYSEARDVLSVAYRRGASGRNIIYRLTKLSALLDDVDEAEELYWEFRRVAPKDSKKLILAYYIICARKEPDSKKIQVLERYVKIDFDERWAYVLAQLYYSEGQIEKCIKICDEIILWYSGSKYGDNAFRLKHKCVGKNEEAGTENVNESIQQQSEPKQPDEPVQVQADKPEEKAEDEIEGLGEVNQFDEILKAVNKVSEGNTHNDSDNQENVLFWDLKEEQSIADREEPDINISVTEPDAAEVDVNISETEPDAAEVDVNISETEAAVAAVDLEENENKDTREKQAYSYDSINIADYDYELSEKSSDSEKKSETVSEPDEELNQLVKEQPFYYSSTVSDEMSATVEMFEDKERTDALEDSQNINVTGTEEDFNQEKTDKENPADRGEFDISQFWGWDVQQEENFVYKQGEGNILKSQAEDELAAAAETVSFPDINPEEKLEMFDGESDEENKPEQKFRVIGYLDEQNVFNAAENTLDKNKEVLEGVKKTNAEDGERVREKSKYRRHSSKQVNIRVYLMECSQMRGGVKYAANRLRNIHKDLGIKLTGVAKITDAKFSIRGAENSINVLKGRDLVVEGVTDITYESVNEMVRLMNEARKPAVVVLLDTPTKLALFINRHRSFAERCTYIYEDDAINRTEFIQYINSYALKLNAVLDDTADEALEEIADEIIEDGISFTVPDAAELVDLAVGRALKPGLKGLFEAKKDSDGYLILRSHHFDRG